MKKSFCLLFAITLALFLQAQAPVLGVYSPVSIAQGGNLVITPSAPPTGAIRISATTNTAFKGSLLVNPVTGKLQVTNASPNGTYQVSVKAVNASSAVTTTVMLTVTNGNCSQGLFERPKMIDGGTAPSIMAIGDFNNDGIQDMAVASNGTAATLSCRIGDGNGGFSGTVTIGNAGPIYSLALADFNNDGNLDMATSNGSAILRLLMGDGTGTFATPVQIGTINNFSSIITGDFNTDGNQDIAAVGSNILYVYPGDGTGAMAPPATYPLQRTTLTLEKADFNSDGRPDIIIGTANTFILLLANSSGGFTQAFFEELSDAPRYLAVGDFNNDGKQDFMASVGITVASRIAVRLGNGAGGFTTAPDLRMTYPMSLAAGDLNGDGYQDMAVASLTGNIVYVRLGDGAGNFPGVADMPLTGGYLGITVGDFNQDGRQDLAVSKNAADSIAILINALNEIGVKGNGADIDDGTVTSSISNHTDFGNAGVVTRTFTIFNTGKVKLAIRNIFISSQDSAFFKRSGISLPANIGAGDSATFTITFSPTSVGSKSAIINILNDDCDESLYDFAVRGNGLAPVSGSYANNNAITAGGNYSVIPTVAPVNASSIFASAGTRFKGQLLANSQTGKITITNAHPAGTHRIRVTTFNGLVAVADSFNLVVGNPPCNQLSFLPPVSFAAGSTPTSIVTSDFNNDGKQDIAMGTVSGISVLIGNGNGGFIPLPGDGSGNTKSIATSDFNGDGNADLIIADGVSGNVRLRLGNGSGGFTTGATTPAGTTVYAVVAGDFNQDGKPDFATANYGSGNVSVRLGDGAGGFYGTTNLISGTNPMSIVAGDFNNDGRQDLAVANYSSSYISIFPGTGNGNFSGPIHFVSDSYNRLLTTGDFNGDGNEDLAVVSQSVMTKIYTGTGLFGFNLSATIDGYVNTVKTGDLNGDGFEDLLATGNGGNSINIYAGKGDGNFTEKSSVSLANPAYAITGGDFNADGNPDFAITTYTSNSAGIFLGNANRADINLLGNGIDIPDKDSLPALSDLTDFGNANSSILHTFSIQNQGLVPLTIKSIAIIEPSPAFFTSSGLAFPATVAPGASANFTINFNPKIAGLKKALVKIENDDCDETVYDFAVQGTGGGVLPVLGAYPAVVAMKTGAQATVNAVSVPVNVSSLTAITSSLFKGILQVNPVTGVVTVTNAYPAGTYTVAVSAIGIVTTTRSFTLVVTGAACSQGLFKSGLGLTYNYTPTAIENGDFNNDGIQDIVCLTGPWVTTRLGDGTGGFTEGKTILTSDYPYRIVVSDFNGDGNQDLAMTAENGSSFTKFVQILPGDGLGGFSTSYKIQFPNNVIGITAADFNEDGRIDLLATNLYANNVSLQFGDGFGAFSGNVNIATGTVPYDVAAGDFDSDGHQDFVVANRNSNSVSVHYGNGLGNFPSSNTLPVGINPNVLTLTDFNNDGRPDIATANYGNNTVTIILSSGPAGFGFATPINLNVGTQPNSIVTGDFNGDGKQDFAVSNRSSSNVYVRLGNGAGGFAPATILPMPGTPICIAAGDYNNDNRQDLAISSIALSTVSLRLGTDKEIGIKGNNQDIPDGDTIPRAANFTDFGSIVPGTTLTRTFTIQNTGTGNLAINTIRLSGADSAQFSVAGISLPASIASGADTTFTLKFSPLTPGVKKTTLLINNDDCDESVYDFALKGGMPPPGAALDFDGIDDYVSVNNNLGNFGDSGITISGWVRTNAVQELAIISRTNCVTGSGIRFGITASGKLTLRLADNSTAQVLTGRSAINDSNWHQVTCTRNDSSLRFYIDGLPDTSVAINAVVHVLDSTLLVIGAAGCSTNQSYFKGQMDEIKIYDRALTIGEIQSHLSCELGSVRSGIRAYYKFNQGIAGDSNANLIALIDSSGDSNTGLLHNFSLSGSVSNWVVAGAVMSGDICSGRSMWLGHTRDWNDRANWSAGFVPSAFTRVVINGNMANMPEITSSGTTCFSLSLTNGANVVVRSSATLNILH